jgi:hypothetical protein
MLIIIVVVGYIPSKSYSRVISSGEDEHNKGL